MYLCNCCLLGGLGGWGWVGWVVWVGCREMQPLFQKLLVMSAKTRARPNLAQLSTYTNGTFVLRYHNVPFVCIIVVHQELSAIMIRGQKVIKKRNILRISSICKQHNLRYVWCYNEYMYKFVFLTIILGNFFGWNINNIYIWLVLICIVVRTIKSLWGSFETNQIFLKSFPSPAPLSPLDLDKIQFPYCRPPSLHSVKPFEKKMLEKERS